MTKKNKSRKKDKEYTEVKGRKNGIRKKKKKKTERNVFLGCNEGIHEANTHNRYEALKEEAAAEAKETQTIERTSQPPQEKGRYRCIVTPKINSTCNIVMICNICGDHCIEGKCQCENLEDKKKRELTERIEEMRLATLTRMRDSASISACGKITENIKHGWTRMSLAVDSGACESVINPDDAPGHDIMDTAESRRGENFASATGEPIPNLGIVQLPMVLREMSVRSMKLCAAPVTRPLASVKKICKAGHMIIFDDEGSYIYNKSTGEINMLREEEGNYMLDVWVPPKDMKPADAIKSVRRQP